MSSKPEKTEAAPVVDPTVALQGRLDAFAAEIGRLAGKLNENTAALQTMAERFGELSVGAPREHVEPVPLTRAQIEDIVRARPQASFRLLQDVASPSFNRARGSIIRPQTLDPTIWRILLGSQVRMADADEAP